MALTPPLRISAIASASVVVLPYDSRDQVTSGVLVDAIAAGRPVIATATGGTVVFHVTR